MDEISKNIAVLRLPIEETLRDSCGNVSDKSRVAVWKSGRTRVRNGVDNGSVAQIADKSEVIHREDGVKFASQVCDQRDTVCGIGFVGSISS